jgi:hypothetical protein
MDCSNCAGAINFTGAANKMTNNNNSILKRPDRLKLVVLTFVAIICFLSGRDFLSQHKCEPLMPGEGVTQSKMLSTWHSGLGGSRADTEVYFFESNNKGGTVLVLGGTHPNEPAAYMAAVLILENARIDRGRMILIPRANASAFSSTEPQEGHPQRYSINSSDGSPRWFRMGGRLSNPLDQWPDPEIAIHNPSGQALSGNETRNLNRCFPGSKNGNFTEQVAFAISKVIEDEAVDLIIDLHEASIEYPVINALVAHERAGDLAAAAVFGLEMKGLKFSLESSPKNLHGLSHRELGDTFENLLATLMESANPIQGRLRGKTCVEQIIEGRDECYLRAEKIGMNKVEFPGEGIPLKLRVMRHLEGVKELLAALDFTLPDKAISISGLPSQEDLMGKGLSPWLKPVDDL